jgi:Cu-processing system ATP-binding protein
MTDVIRSAGLSKHYGATAALDGLTLDVRAGELVALLGHNGAGKTTAMKLWLGLTRPTAGAVEVLGAPPGGSRATALRRAIGFLPENVRFADGMTGAEALAFYARLKGADRSSAAALLEQVGLAEAAQRRIRTYSKGMCQRLGLAQALIGRPRLLLLDEPTTGLDPVFRRRFFAILEELKKGGATVVLSSHVLTELELRTDRIAILRHGRLVACDTLEGLRRSAGLPVRIRVRAEQSEADSLVRRVGGDARVVEANGRTVELAVGAEAKMEAVRRLAAGVDGVEDLDILPPSLEEIYAVFGSRETGP